MPRYKLGIPHRAMPYYCINSIHIRWTASVMFFALHIANSVVIDAHLMRHHGGVVTQRIANPCTPVRFRVVPPFTQPLGGLPRRGLRECLYQPKNESAVRAVTRNPRRHLLAARGIANPCTPVRFRVVPPLSQPLGGLPRRGLRECLYRSRNQSIVLPVTRNPRCHLLAARGIAIAGMWD